MNIKNIINKFIINLIGRRQRSFYANQFRQYLVRLGLSPEKEAEGEDRYRTRWSVFGHKVEPYSYRLFSRYCGPSEDIVPEGIGSTYIEGALNPVKFMHFYSDKNAYRMYIDPDLMPKTILSRIGGGTIRDDKNNEVDKVSIDGSTDCVILKPSTDSCSGRGIECFRKTSSGWIAKDGTELTINYLKNYGDNFILQEAVRQHPYISQFCSTCVNTFRIAVYKSVKDDSSQVVGSIMRIGIDGSVVDNAHAGGRFIGIDKENGKLKNYVCDTYGNVTNIWNNVDFATNQFVIPNWSKVIEFAKTIGNSVPHMRLLALDICLDENGEPKLIEFNVGGFSYWLFMYTGTTPFGQYTDEIIEYSKNHLPSKVNFQVLHN